MREPDPYDYDDWDEFASEQEPPPRETHREPVRERPRERRSDPDWDLDRSPSWGDDDDRDRRRGRRDRPPRRGFSERFRGPSADSIGRIIQIGTALISLMFVLHIIFVVSGANQDNGFVSFAYSVAKFFVFGLGDVFTPGDATIGVVLNYGLAALIYLVGGRIVARALTR